MPAYPTASSGIFGGSTGSFAINNSGQSVGFYHPASGDAAYGGFLYSGGSFTSLAYPPGSAYTYPFNLNNAGQIVGQYYDGTTNHAYVESGGVFTTADDPATSTDTYLGGINDAGTAVGDYTPTDATPAQQEYFEPLIYSGGVFTNVAGLPGYAATSFQEINNADEIVGYASNDLVDGTDPEGFIYEDGVYTEVNDPLGVGGTYIYGINNEGDITGTYVDADGNEQAFIATPVPEPASLAMFAVGLIGFGFARWRKRS